MPASSPEKLALIEELGGSCHLVDDPDDGPEAQLARERDSPSSITYAERATDWRGNSNIAESIYSRCPNTTPSPPVVVGPEPAGPATIGRYAICCAMTRLLVVDPRIDLLRKLDGRPVEIHRPAVAHRRHRAPASRHRYRDIIDRMMQVPDAADRDDAPRANAPPSAVRPGQRLGAFVLIAEMLARREQGIVTLICDSGDRARRLQRRVGRRPGVAPYAQALETPDRRVPPERRYDGGIG
jgi:cysteine synthase A